VQDVLERYFKEMAAIIFSEHGTIDKYIGDAILAFFENSVDEVTSASTAIRCAVAMQEKAEELDTIYKSQNRFPFSIRIGVTTGYAKVGNIGPVEKYDYTIIGSVVNLANRLQALGSSGDIIFEKETLFFVKDDYEFENMGKQNLKGFTDPVEVHKIKI
jgi:class 3 adenylate cyclase